MLETYFVRPSTVDRIRASWIAPEVERYVAWLGEHGYAARCVLTRVPLVLAFGEFARAGGAGGVEDLPGHVEGFVAARVARRGGERDGRRQVAREVRGPVEQMLDVVSRSPGSRPGSLSICAASGGCGPGRSTAISISWRVLRRISDGSGSRGLRISRPRS